MSLTIEQELLFSYFKMTNVSFAEETVNVYQSIVTSLGTPNDSEQSLCQLLHAMNNVLKQYELEIVEGVDEATGRTIHCLISTNNNNLAQKASFYDKYTTELLSKIIQECVISEKGSVSEIFCLNCSTNLCTNKTNLQSSLQRLIKDKWIVTENGQVTLGARSKLELESLIRKQYPNNVKHCVLCKTFLIQGKSCTNCDNYIHNHCLKKFNNCCSLDQSSALCPVCTCNSEEMEVENNNDETAFVTDDPPAKRLRKSNFNQ